MIQPLDNLSKQKINRYEAVIIAAKKAHRLNEKLKKEQEQQNLFDEPTGKNGVNKVTSLALQELLNGQVQFEKPSQN